MGNQFLVDVELAAGRHPFSLGGVGLAGRLELIAQLDFAFRNRLTGMQPEPVPAQVVIKEVESLILDEEGVSAGVAALGQQDALCATLGDHHLGCDAPGPVVGLGRGGKGNRRPTRVKDKFVPRFGDGRALHVEALNSGAVDRQHLVLARFGPPAADQLDQLVAMFSGQVVGFGIVLVQVVQLPVVGLDIQEHLVIDGGSKPAAFLGGLGEIWTRPGADRPPAVVIDRTMAEHLEILGVVIAGCFYVIEGMGETDPIDGRLGHAADAIRRFHAKGFQNCRDEVDDVRVMRSYLAFCLDTLRPGDDARVGRAAPVGLALPAAEGRVAGIGPAPGIVVVGLDAAQLIEHLEVILERFLHVVEEEHLVERADRPALGAGAVVGDDHDQRIVQLADIFQELEDAPEVVVGEADEAGIDLHEPGIQPPGIGRQRLPNRHVRVVRRQLGARRDDAHLELALVDDLAVFVPAHIEFTLVLVRPLLGNMMRGMPGPRGVIHVEGLVRRVDVRILDEFNGFIGQVAAQVVALLWRAGRFHGVVVVGQLGEPLVGFAAQEAVKTFEAAPERPAVVGSGCSGVFGGRQVPFPDAEGVVALLAAASR